jgi:hypothetical protein
LPRKIELGSMAGEGLQGQLLAPVIAERSGQQHQVVLGGGKVLSEAVVSTGMGADLALLEVVADLEVELAGQ